MSPAVPDASHSADPQHEHTSASRPEPAEDASPQEIEADIERTRHELGDTVATLSEKLDPKAQAQRQVEDIKDRSRQQFEQARQTAQATVERAREAAQSSVEQARDAVVDTRGRPTHDAWAALVAGTGIVLAVTGVIIMRRSR